MFSAKKPASLKKWIEGDCSGNLLKLYLRLLERGSQSAPEEEKAEQDAKALFEAGEKKLGTNEQVFIDILTQQRAHVERVSSAYAKAHGKPLEEAVKAEFSGALKEALVALCMPLPKFFSGKLMQAMKGLGTDDWHLIRIICSQKERNLKEIASQFQQDHKKPLIDWVKDECSGDYKKLLVAVLENFA